MYPDKEYYLLYSRMRVHKNRIKKAIEISKDALGSAERPLVSFSGGKDSIVMLDILIRSGFKGEMVFFKYGIKYEQETPAETMRIVQYYSDKYRLKCNIVPCLGEFDCWDQLGYFCLFPETKEEIQIFRKTNHDFSAKSKAFEIRHNCDLSFIGMRKEESKTRRIVLSCKGNIYTTKERTSKTCCPIANFTSDDIWAYIYNHQLKYPSFYDIELGDRRQLRNEPCLLYNDAIYRHGATEDMKIMFPDYFKEIKSRYPDAII